MVRIAELDGAKIHLYFDEHPPPHIHVISGEAVAMVAIDPPTVLRGALPRALERRVLEWVGSRRDPLSRAWQDVQEKRKPGKIP